MRFRHFSFRIWLVATLLILTLAPGPSVTGAGTSCYLDMTEVPAVEYCPAFSGNYSRESRTAKEIQYIVIHTVQGSLDSAIHTFSSSNLSYRRSAHYTVGISGKVVKSVPTRKVAWHTGTSKLGSGEKHESRVLNSNSIGIEHGGYVDGPNFPTRQQYFTSAALTRYLCELYDIPMDRRHIVGHDEIKSTKGDPGPNWDWDYYMSLVRNGSKEVPGQPGKTWTKEIKGGGSLLSSGLVAAGAALAVFGFLNLSS
ncbi:N-acetylmuramoyl-L-alanine amidase [Candidatus Bipolaricaulota bacterium]|nr:N-acetylmuramoyl-L-alanine amidase [Candidatus Bipolaricaulota bacterium]